MSWWEPFYDDLLAEMLLVRDGDEITDTLAFLRRVGLRDGARVFDQCCGIGSLAIPLAAAGHPVVGVDQAAAYVERARRAAPPGASFHTGDAFRFVCDPPADFCINWWTSFGYAETDGENAAMLRRAFESLRPGGTFVLDTMNVANVLFDFRPTVVTERDTPLGRIRLVRESRLDLASGHLEKVWRYELPGREPVVHRSRVRLISPHRIAELLRGVGFGAVELFGGVDGRALDRESPRCIAVARRQP